MQKQNKAFVSVAAILMVAPLLVTTAVTSAAVASSGSTAAPVVVVGNSPQTATFVAQFQNKLVIDSVPKSLPVGATMLLIDASWFAKLTAKDRTEALARIEEHYLNKVPIGSLGKEIPDLYTMLDKLGISHSRPVDGRERFLTIFMVDPSQFIPTENETKLFYSRQYSTVFVNTNDAVEAASIAADVTAWVAEGFTTMIEYNKQQADNAAAAVVAEGCEHGLTCTRSHFDSEPSQSWYSFHTESQSSGDLSKPAGKMNIVANWYILKGDGQPANDYYNIVNTIQAVPGMVAYGSDFENFKEHDIIDTDYYEPSNAMIDHGPSASGGTTTSYSYSLDAVGMTAFTVSWQKADVTIDDWTDYSIQKQEAAQWPKFPGSQFSTQTYQSKPGVQVQDKNTGNMQFYWEADMDFKDDPWCFPWACGRTQVWTGEYRYAGTIYHSTIGGTASNDNFANAMRFAALPFDDNIPSAYMTAATTEVGEPLPCGLIGKTVWYKFTADATATMYADTFGSSYDTVLAVYTGSSLNALTNLRCNDDSAQSGYYYQSRVSWPATQGAVYYLQVGGFAGASGNLEFQVYR